MSPLETLRALGPGSEPPAESKQRVAGALFAALEAAALASASAPTQQPAPASVLPASSPMLGGLAGSKLAALAASIWLIGGVSGAALYSVLRPPAVRVVYVERPTAASSAMPENSADPVPGAASVRGAPQGVANAAPARVVAERAPLAGAADGDSDLARERALLDLARAAAASGEPAQALAKAELHRARFPRGRLSEEREALAIRALLTLGRDAEARRRARAFQATYPQSFLLPVLESALSTP